MKIYLAGISTDVKLFYNNRDCKYVLISFLETKNLQINNLNLNNLLLDSGAFTYLNSKKNAKVDWEKYINDYANFIKKHDIKYFFELDIDPIVGLKEVERLRSILEKTSGKKSIPVWHKSRGLEYWKKMVKNYDYVAIGGIVTKEIKQKEYPVFTKLLKIAKDNNCRVHGLGFTRTRDLKKYKFYSVDSTNWITTRFNMFYLFDPKNGIMRSNKKNINNKKYRVKKEAISIYNKMQVEQWIKFQQYADKNL